MTHFEPREGKYMKKTPNNKRIKGRILSDKANGYFIVDSGILQKKNEIHSGHDHGNLAQRS